MPLKSQRMGRKGEQGPDVTPKAGPRRRGCLQALDLLLPPMSDLLLWRISGGGREVWRGSPNLDPHREMHVWARACTNTHTHIPRSCQNLSWPLPFPGSGHYPLHPDRTQDLNLIKSDHIHPSPCPTPTLPTSLKCTVDPSIWEERSNSLPQSAGPRDPAMPTPVSPQPHLTGPPSILHRTSQAQCPQLGALPCPCPPPPRGGTVIPQLSYHILREVLPSQSYLKS